LFRAAANARATPVESSAVPVQPTHSRIDFVTIWLPEDVAGVPAAAVVVPGTVEGVVVVVVVVVLVAVVAPIVVVGVAPVVAPVVALPAVVGGAAVVTVVDAADVPALVVAGDEVDEPRTTDPVTELVDVAETESVELAPSDSHPDRGKMDMASRHKIRKSPSTIVLIPDFFG